MKFFFGALAMLCLIVGLTGCSSSIARFPILTTKSTQMTQVDLKRVPLLRDVKGSDDRLWLLCIPLGSKPTIERAVDECLKEGNGDIILNARIDESNWSFLLFSGGGYSVGGDVGNLRNQTPVKNEIKQIKSQEDVSEKVILTSN